MHRRSVCVAVLGSSFLAWAVACGQVEPAEPTAIREDASVTVAGDAGPGDAGYAGEAGDAGDAGDAGGLADGGCADAGYTATVAWNGTPIYLAPTAERRTSKGGSYTYIWGSVFDPEFRVDEGIFAVDLPSSLAPGRYSCVLPEDFLPSGSSAVVYFSEHRGFDFVADPKECVVEVLPSCDVTRPHFRVAASYDSTYYGRVALAATVQ